MVTVWGRQSSSNVQAVLWCLAELKVPFKRIDAGLHYGVTDTPEYLAMNPNGTVPTLQDADNPPLWESAAILRYLADRYAPDTFWPADTIERADVDRWAEWSKVSVAMNFTAPLFWRVVRTPAARRDPDAIRAATAQLTHRLQIADARLETLTFLTGEHLTLADIQFGHILYRYYTMDIQRAELPHLERYYDLLLRRSGFRTHVMVSYEELVDTL